MIASGEASHTDVNYLLGDGLVQNGKVGLLNVKPVYPEDKAPSIELAWIKSKVDYLPDEFGYKGAQGVGSFLLDSLCALADFRGWRVYLEPVDEGGKLQQHELYEWYQRRGFQDDYNYPDATHVHNLGMMREPQAPSNPQAIAQILAQG